MKLSHLAVVLSCLVASLGPPPTATCFQEDFAGAHHLSKAIFDLGLPVISRDILMSRHLDFGGTTGFVSVLNGLRSIIIGGLCWFALPCSSWVFISRGSSKRNRLRPHGQRRYLKVKQANRLARRLVYACRFVEKKGAYWVLEQPVSSLVYLYPPVRALLLQPGVREIRVPLGEYGASSVTPDCA